MEVELEKRSEQRGAAFFVALGIFCSRVLGLIRERVFAHYFGNSEAADAFKAALRIPNVLQNLFGEGVLSGSFIPVYSKLLAEGREHDARTLATNVATVLFLIVSFIVALGVTFAPFLVELIAPGFGDERRELAIRLTRIFFPGIGLLVGSAWCLGVQNSHGKFLLSYSAPVVWNVVIISTLVIFGWLGRSQEELAVIVSWGVVVGCAGQLLVQLPSTLSLLGGWQSELNFKDASVQKVLSNFFPILGGRGIVQISAYIDSLLASLLPVGAVAALSYSQTLYLLPIGLFGMSVSAAELPAMSQVLGEQDALHEGIRQRLGNGLRRITFFVVPSTLAFIGLGDVLISGVYETGEFTRADSLFVWKVLAAASIGLLPATLARLYASTFYALGDARTPLKFSLFRVFVSTILGTLGAVYLPSLLGFDASVGLVFLSGASGLTAVFEFLLLRASLLKKIGAPEPSPGFLLKLFASALIALALGRAVLEVVEGNILRAVLSASIFAISYFVVTNALKIPESKRVLRAITSRLA